MTKVEFRATGGSLSNALLGTGTKSGSVWNFLWNSNGVAVGTYTMRKTSQAFDTAGNSTTSASITVKVDRTAPTRTTIIVPSANGATLKGNARSTRRRAITSRSRRSSSATGSQAALNNVLVATGTLTPYGWIGTWNTASVTVGSYTLKSVAFDAAGNSTTSAARTVNVAR